MPVMADMELDDEAKLDAVLPYAMPTPDYPPGLRICLTREQFDKLDLDASEAVVGGNVHGHFLATITSVHLEDSNDRVEMQIEKLSIESEDEENEKD